MATLLTSCHFQNNNASLQFSEKLAENLSNMYKPYSLTKYRVTKVVGDMGWVDFDFGCYTVFPILLGQMGIWQNPLGNMVEHPI